MPGNRRNARAADRPSRSVETAAPVYADLARNRPLDLRTATAPWRTRHEVGRELRSRTPRRSHGDWRPPADRPDPLDLLDRANAGRLPKLIPLRVARMAASRFGFLRGNAPVMAWDLAHTPACGIDVLLDGDAHLSNFGLFGTVERDIVFDLDDFDESTVGPWEWDVKRLAVSVEVAGRDLGLTARERDAAVRNCLTGYREEVRRLESVGALDIAYRFLFTGREGSDIRLDPEVRRILRRAARKAAGRTNAAFLRQVAERRPDGSWRLRAMPPVQTRVPRAVRAKLVEALTRYAATLHPDRRYLLSRYHVVDVAQHVVGVGSVGTRCYLVLLFGEGETDPLFLQFKEAGTPAAAPYVAPLEAALVREPGRRVVSAQMGLNGSPDILLGWTEMDGRSYYVRQMRNLKGAVPLERLGGRAFPRYVRACGAVLARAHARGGDAAQIAGYWGGGRTLLTAFVRFARAYADQVEHDHAAFVRAMDDGRDRPLRTP